MNNRDEINRLNTEKFKFTRRVRLKYTLAICIIIFSYVFMFFYSVVEPFLTEVFFDGMEEYSKMAWLTLFFAIFCIGADIICKTGIEESKLPPYTQLVSGIEDYKDLLDRVNHYAMKHDYVKNELYLNDTNHDEYFTMFTNHANPVEIIGVYYSDEYKAEHIYSTKSGAAKEIRLSNNKELNAKCAPFIDAFCGKKEDTYLKRDLSLPPKPINKIFVVMIDPKEKNQSSWEQWLLEEGHEQHVLFVLIYEDKPECIYIGPDNRRYADDSYMGAIQVLNEMLHLNIDVSKL